MAASRQQRSLPPSRRLTRFGRTATRNSSEPHARALRRLHNDVAHPWSVEELAKEAGLSRSVFSERFGQKVGVPPMQYLMDWRMALAKAMLQRDAPPLEAVAVAIGYQSASAFSTAFRREVGSPPSHFARTAAG